jgi:adenosylhomocysteine nucleosidase
MAATCIALLAPMVPELRPLLKRTSLTREEHGGTVVHTGRIGRTDVVATMTGIGTQPARDTTARILDLFDVSHVVVVGVAGGVGPSVAIGDLVIPEAVRDGADGPTYRPQHLGSAAPRGTIITSDQFGYDEPALDRFIAEDVVALDMETAAVAAVCQQRGVPWSTFRAISDRGDDDTVDVAMLEMAGPDGSGDGKAVARYLLRRPWRIFRLAKLGRDSAAAANRAAESAVRTIEAYQ